LCRVSQYGDIWQIMMRYVLTVRAQGGSQIRKNGGVISMATTL
jgi:hypothetical protein